MATATEMFSALEDQVLETVRQSQEAVVKAVKTWAEAGKSIVPDLPPLPFADQLPNTVDIVENAFNFADKLLAVQREFAAAILEAAKPVLGKAEAPKTTNSRSTAAKSSAN
ncbi:MAG: hypothetical protein ACRDHK_06610 [Actinomycetota bacterium]